MPNLPAKRNLRPSLLGSVPMKLERIGGLGEKRPLGDVCCFD
jgi:hypothetical protein